jgi:hypothetical protein
MVSVQLHNTECNTTITYTVQTSDRLNQEFYSKSQEVKEEYFVFQQRLGKISEGEECVIRDLRDLVKFRILTAEHQNTEGSLQTLLYDIARVLIAL